MSTLSLIVCGVGFGLNLLGLFGVVLAFVFQPKTDPRKAIS
jgi:hypothetical protein